MLITLGRGTSPITKNSLSHFSPLSLSNLALWLDAYDTDTITETAGAVSQWADKSGNNNHAIQGTGSYQPVTGTRTINGKNSLDFSGANYLELTSYIPYLSTNGYTAFILMNGDDFTGADEDGLLGGNTGYSFGVRIETNPEGQVQILKRRTAVILTLNAISSNSDFALVAQSYGSGNNLWINGGTSSSNTTDPEYDSNGINIIGAQATGSDYFDGKIGEIIIYKRQLNSSEINQVGSYLAAKWGITWTNV